MSKAAAAFRTISEVSEELDVPKHVLRFWELKFSQLKPMKRGGGRRYYRPEDLEMLRGIRHLLYGDGYTIKGVQKILRERGIQEVKAVVGPLGFADEGALKERRNSKPTSTRGARGKGAGAVALKGAVARKGRAGKRGGDGKSVGQPALSAKGVKAVERVIKELQLCRNALRGPAKVSVVEKSVPSKARRSRAAR